MGEEKEEEECVEMGVLEVEVYSAERVVLLAVLVDVEEMAATRVALGAVGVGEATAFVAEVEGVEETTTVPPVESLGELPLQ